MSENKNCPFCENLKKTKEDWAYFKETSPRHCVQTARKEYKVALIEETYEEAVDYRTGLITHQFMDLNFCPVCGKKIEEEEEKTLEMTREQRIELCRVYNNSDADAFLYMKPFCNSEQLELLEKLIALNAETDLGWGEEPSSPQEGTMYYKGKWALLNYFGIENRDGDGYFEGEFYN